MVPERKGQRRKLMSARLCKGEDISEVMYKRTYLDGGTVARWPEELGVEARPIADDLNLRGTSQARPSI